MDYDAPEKEEKCFKKKKESKRLHNNEFSIHSRNDFFFSHNKVEAGMFSFHSTVEEVFLNSIKVKNWD